MFLGVWVAVQSFLGFPIAWDMVILAVLGTALLCLGIILRHEALVRLRKRVIPETPGDRTSTTIGNEERNEVSRG